MKTIKLFRSNLFLVTLMILSMASCDDTTFYPLIESVPCSKLNVVPDPNIITDFECQANITLPKIEAILNPDESDINMSRFVGKYIDPAAPWDALIIDFKTPINLSKNNVFKIKVKTKITGTLKAKLEGGTSNGIEKDATITNTQGWVEYSYDFSDQFNANHTKLVIFFNAGADTNGFDIYYIDDLKFETSQNPCAGINPDLSIVNDFDCQKNQTVPEVDLIATPFKSTINSSKFAGKYIDELGAWDAIIIDYGTVAINLTTNNVFKIKVYAPATGVLKAKLEGGTSSGIEKDAIITKTGEWIEYSFDFSSQATGNHKKIVLFFNAGVDTNGKDVYYIDDLKWSKLINSCTGVVKDLSIINDFNCQQNSTIPGYITNSIVDNPNRLGLNPSDKVLKVIDNGTDAWDALVLDLGRSQDLTTKHYLRIKVLSTKAVPLLAKLEGGSSPAAEVWGSITTIDKWTEYQFDFSAQATKDHKKVVLFFNGGESNGTVTDVYYIDDIKFEKFDSCFGIAPDVTVVNDFECQQNYIIPGFIVNTIVTNPNKTGINTSNFVLKVTDNGTDAWDALLFDFGKAIDLSTKNQLKIKILSTKTVPLLVKLEGGTSGAKEIWGSITTVNNWTEYTFDFGSEASANHKKIVFFFNGGKSDGTATDIYHIDDIKWQ